MLNVTSARSSAEKYLNYDFAIIPLRSQDKLPTQKNWQNTKPGDNSETDFTEDNNIGVVLGKASRGIVDVDIDNTDALMIANRFLPATGMIFGRSSKPASHYIYRVVDPQSTTKFKSENGTIIELRGNGGQTMFPPSTHPSGEQVRFDKDGEPADANWSELETACRLIATAVQIAPCWVEGKRHELALSISGVLLKAGVSEQLTKTFIDAVCDLVNDADVDDRLRTCADTISVSRNNKPIASWSKLKGLIDEKSYEALSKWWGATNQISSTASSVDDDDFPAGSRNDEGNAKRTLKRHQEDIRFVHEFGCFLVWDGTIWIQDKGNYCVRDKCLEAVQHHFDEKINETGTPYEGREKTIKFLASSKNLNRLNAQIELLKSSCLLPSERVDANNVLLGCQSGVIDLSTSQQVAAQRDMCITKQMDVAYDPLVTCPNFEKFISEMFKGDADKVAFMQRYFGYCLSGETKYQFFPILIGPAASGKSTLINVIKAIMGPYAADVMPETLFDGQKGSNANYDLATLKGCRLVIAQEAESNQPINSRLVKQLTGSDTIKARQVYQEPQSFRPQAKYLMVANMAPTLNAYDDGLRRRVLMIEATNKVPPLQRDHDLEAKLLKEKSGILNWLLDGSRDVQKSGLLIPNVIKQASKRLFANNDDIGSFMEECTKDDPSSSVSKTDLYIAYDRWCSENGIHPREKKAFGAILKNHFKIGDCRTNSERGWKSIRLLSASEVDDALSDEPGALEVLF